MARSLIRRTRLWLTLTLTLPLARALTLPGIPLVYELDINLKPIPDPLAVYPLTGKFLTDAEALRKAQEEVANQSKLRYSQEE